MKEYWFTLIVGTVGGFIARQLGGWDTYLQILVTVMGVDYITGFIVAGVFKASKKSKTGGLSSHKGFLGILKKTMILVMVYVGYQIDVIVGWNDFVRYAVIVGFIANEAVSITENAGLMGVPIPAPIKKAIALLHEKGDVDNENDKRN